ncbi:MAG: T9SS type A sorting domain-containing protein [Saprospiraceae bacterium]
MKLSIQLLLGLVFPAMLAAQKRYFDPVFPEVKLSTNVCYGKNITIIQPGPFPPEASPQILKMDVYEPLGDSANARPLVILLHGGIFLPPLQNGTCNGTKQDGEIVEIAKRLARRGFVVAAMDYRIGWNPLANTEIGRRFSFVNAVHRAVQDSRTCIRFFRKNHAENNQFRIDSAKITLWGTGSGSFISLASATLDDVNDWEQPKFHIPNFGPMVQDSINGNLDGTSVGLVPPDYLTGHAQGDTFCIPNHLGFSSDFALAVNMSEGLLDTTWLQNNDVPILSFASPSVILGGPISQDPCGMHCLGCEGFPIPTPVLGEIAGSCVIQALQSQLGNNEVWLNAVFSDPLSIHALSINNGHEGFYPFWGSSELTPWAFSSIPWPNFSCDTNSVEAGIYLDTVLAYFAPRACALLGLDINCTPVIPVNEPSPINYLLEISPNPSTGKTHIVATKSIFSLELYDSLGNCVQRRTGLNTLEIWLQQENLPSGIYWLKAYFERGIGVSKLIWE